MEPRRETGLRPARRRRPGAARPFRAGTPPGGLDDGTAGRPAHAQTTASQQSEAAVALGYRYHFPGGDAALPEIADPAYWRGEPGTQVPHWWLPDGRSTPDLPDGGRHHLLAGPAAAFLGFTVLPAAVDDPGTGSHGAPLIRPDQVVAWRTTDTAPEPALTALQHHSFV
ncbi:hypothetical protein [Dactylosporangium sp. CA-233914]|uniref:aromatic-ring hydroxylase C-terminal domain-containing protein n=1 Tax=Dactylosporangium sp. CA-233914 TaxID=3239934 RepID=UPI003D8F6FAB